VIKDYNIYEYTKREYIKYLFMGAVLGAFIGYVFYSNVLGVIILIPYGFLYVRNKKKDLIHQRKWELNLQFRDGLMSVSAALNAGYSVENSFSEAICDLKLMYPPDAIIIKEFEKIAYHLNMNVTLEDILRDFSKRSDVDDILNFTEVLITAKSSGGDLIKIIKSTTNIISDKIEVKREIITLTTAKKLEASIMSVIPLGIVVYLRAFSPGLLEPLYHNVFGFLFMTIILIIYYITYLMTKKITDINI
jgi:tight adherence protein B